MQDGSCRMPCCKGAERSSSRNPLKLVCRAFPVHESFRHPASEIRKIVGCEFIGIGGTGGIQGVGCALPIVGLDLIPSFIDICLEMTRRNELPQDEE